MVGYKIGVGVFLLFVAGGTTMTRGQDNTVIYVPVHRDSVLEVMRLESKDQEKVKDSVSAAIKDAQEKQKEVDRQNQKELRFDFSGLKKPESPESFGAYFHFPPVRQYSTGTCWSFSTVSFLESEVYRLTGRKIKLSEMYPVYFEYLEKVKRYVSRRGDSEVSAGSEGNAVLRNVKLYGMVPAEVYPGYINDPRYDDDKLNEEISNYLKLVSDHGYWDEAQVLGTVAIILDKYMGRPPESFEFEGQTITPLQFSRDILKLNPDDYVDIMSTAATAFYSFGEFKVPDNWWHDSSYYNVPLDQWYELIKKAIGDGYTIAIGGDVSEPGLYGLEDVGIVPEFDIPQKFINQDSRELRIYNHTTTDDHGIHLVGYKRVGGRDWFLIKDSGSGAQWGQHKGYYFYRDDFIRLKMLTFMVHKDAVRSTLEKYSGASSR